MNDGTEVGGNGRLSNHTDINPTFTELPIAAFAARTIAPVRLAPVAPFALVAVADEGLFLLTAPADLTAVWTAVPIDAGEMSFVAADFNGEDHPDQGLVINQNQLIYIFSS